MYGTFDGTVEGLRPCVLKKLKLFRNEELDVSVFAAGDGSSAAFVGAFVVESFALDTVEVAFVESCSLVVWKMFAVQAVFGEMAVDGDGSSPALEDGSSPALEDGSLPALEDCSSPALDGIEEFGREFA